MDKVKAEDVLDDAALSLFQQLGGIDERNRLKPLEESNEDDPDDWRILLFELTDSIARQLTISRSNPSDDKRDSKENPLDGIVEKLARLFEFPNKRKILTLRYRGMVFSLDRQSAREFDYEISYGKLVVDLPVVKEIAGKKGGEKKDLPRRLNEAFAKFAEMEINTLQIDLGEWKSRDMAKTKACFKVLSGFFATSGESSFPVVIGAKRKPDPNLTLMAAINRMKAPVALDLVKKVALMMKSAGANNRFNGIYDAVFAVPKLQKQLVKPTVEINNVRYLELLKDCFDQDGCFLRNAFEKNIPEFVKAEKNVFGFLWNDLKRIRNNRDRVAFLNALQFIIAEMKAPHQAIQLLLEDFSTRPDTIHYIDQSALMLSNLLVRNYNKELRIDIEITPEEVLNVKSGLNRKMVAFANKLIDGNIGENFYQKILETHKKLSRALNGEKGEKKPTPPKFLISLEREACIFLSLTGGPTAHKIVRDSVEEYGNPGSKIYKMEKSRENLRAMLAMIQTSARGLARFGDADDVGLLEAVRARSTQFKTLVSDSTFRDLVDRVMEHVDVCIDRLYEKHPEAGA